MPKKRKSKKASVPSKQAELPRIDQARIWPWAFASAVVLWLAYPPVGLAALAWIAPVGWLVIAARVPRLSRLNYITLWLSGCVFWLALLQGIRLAFWPLYFGWVAISLYLAVYVPAFVYGVRKLRLAWRWPLFLAAPVCWVALEFVRTYLLTGYCANMIAHSQVDFASLTQIADTLGAFGISFVVLCVAGAIADVLTPLLPGLTDESADISGGRKSGSQDQPKSATPHLLGVLKDKRRGILAAGSLVIASVSYGQMRLRQSDVIAEKRKSLLRVQLVQENSPTYFEANSKLLQESWSNYLEITRKLAKDEGPADLVVWPESTFSAGLPWIDPEIPTDLPTELAENRDFFLKRTGELSREFSYKVRRTLEAASGMEFMELNASETVATSLLLGCDSARVTPEKLEKYNSAILIDPQGSVTQVYSKTHRVMFGEYIPLGVLLKPLRDAFPIGVDAGDSPVAMKIEGTIVSPNICFESMMPRVVLSQVRKLKSAGSEPAVIVNLSNDSWFRGSSILDHHLACTRLSAIELRKPTLVAANTGLSAWIDGAGRLVKRTQRGQVTGILAEPREDNRFSGPISFGGYPLAWLCGILLFSALIFRRRGGAIEEDGGSNETRRF